MISVDHIVSKALRLEPLTVKEAVCLYTDMPLNELAMIANELRYQFHPSGIVTWQIDRNVNSTNVCISGCKFCNFYCKPHHREKAFITSLEEYCRKIEETFALGGDQLLLQGGLHPELDICYYETLFRELKKRYPEIKLHALGPPEIAHIARIGKLDYRTVLERLTDAGLDSLPGAGAEILSDEVRRAVSPGKASAEVWLEVMGTAHEMGISTSATMMYGHVETIEQRMEHLVKLRDLQARKPEEADGFIAFIPWIFWSKGTELERQGVETRFDPLGYIRMIAISRIVLNNIRNIQASWLTVGREAGQLCLHAGANDMGSIMIEENVVSSAGARFRMDAEDMRRTIRDAGFEPRLRDQRYRYRLETI